MTARLATALRMFGHAIDMACMSLADAMEIACARVPDTVPDAWIDANAEWVWWEQ